MKSEDAGPKSVEAQAVRTWLLVLGLGASILLWGAFLFFAVGDKGPPPWDFGVIDDLPGSSPYSTHGPKQLPLWGPAQADQAPAPQHVGGKGSR